MQSSSDNQISRHNVQETPIKSNFVEKINLAAYSSKFRTRFSDLHNISFASRKPTGQLTGNNPVNSARAESISWIKDTSD